MDVTCPYGYFWPVERSCPPRCNIIFQYDVRKEGTPDEPSMSLPILDLSLADDARSRPGLLEKLRTALFDVGFLYVKNHGVDQGVIASLSHLLPKLFELPAASKLKLSKLNSPHFLGYNGYAEEKTLGKKDLREQFDYATELPVIWSQEASKVEMDGWDYSRLFWRLRGPNQWPSESDIPGFRKAFTDYHDAISSLSYRFVHLVEEAFGIPIGTFDHFFDSKMDGRSSEAQSGKAMLPQHRIKLLKYPKTNSGNDGDQGVGPHKDSSGWLTFLHQVGDEPGLEVLGKDGRWITAPPISGTLVVNFGNAIEAATEGAVRATVHRVKAPRRRDRYSIPFFMGLPLDLTVSEIRSYIPEHVRLMRKEQSSEDDQTSFVSSFLDSRWDSLGESQLRKWIRSHEDVGRKWYGEEMVEFYIK